METGKYVPPHRRRVAEAAAGDSEVARRQAFDALRKTLRAAVNRVTPETVGAVARELLAENLIAGRGLLCQVLMEAQNVNPDFTAVFAGLAATVNQHYPDVGLLLVRRLAHHFKRLFRRRHLQTAIGAGSDAAGLAATGRFLAALVVERVADQVVLLQLLAATLAAAPGGAPPLLVNLEVAGAVLREAYGFLRGADPEALAEVMAPLHELFAGGALDVRSTVVVRDLLAQVRAMEGELADRPLAGPRRGEEHMHDVDLDEDQTGAVALELNRFRPAFDPDEGDWEAVRARALPDADFSDAALHLALDAHEAEVEAADAAEAAAPPPAPDALGGARGGEMPDDDPARRRLLRREVHLAVSSSVRSEEAAHKLLALLQRAPGAERVVAEMLLEVLRQDATFDPLHANTAALLCRARGELARLLERQLAVAYDGGVDEMPLKDIDITARFFAHLLQAGALPWRALSPVSMGGGMRSSQGIFVKVLLQELASCMGAERLAAALQAPAVACDLPGLAPADADGLELAVEFYRDCGRGGVDLAPLCAPLAARLDALRSAEMASAGKRPRDS